MSENIQTKNLNSVQHSRTNAAIKTCSTLKLCRVIICSMAIRRPPKAMGYPVLNSHHLRRIIIFLSHAKFFLTIQKTTYLEHDIIYPSFVYHMYLVLFIIIINDNYLVRNVR